jgi:hypothetical protein
MTQETHQEMIVCPGCMSPELATVEHTVPWWSYVHECGVCRHMITESEWTRVKGENSE